MNGNIISIVLQEQLSTGNCRETIEWGYTDILIWVDDGCKAKFDLCLSIGKYLLHAVIELVVFDRLRGQDTLGRFFSSKESELFWLSVSFNVHESPSKMGTAEHSGHIHNVVLAIITHIL